MKKICLMLLVCALIFSTLLVSCKKKEPEPSDDTTSQKEEETTIPDRSGEFDVPADLAMGNREIKVLTYNCSVPEFGDVSIEKPDAVDRALVNRDNYVQDYLDVYFTFDRADGQFNQRKEFVSKVEQGMLDQENPWDIIGAYSLIPPVLAVKGYLKDLTETKYVDLEKNWWPVYMVDACRINDRAYYCSGDISSNLLYYMQAIIFNLSVVEQKQLAASDLYACVERGEWTLEHFFELTENMSEDLEGDGWDADDFYAISMESATVMDSLYTATGLKLVEKGENDVLRVSDDILSDKTLTLYSMVYDAINTYHNLRISNSGSPLRDGKCAFGIYTVYQMRTSLAENVTGYRFLPFPKFSENDGYRTLISNPHTQYCIPKNANTDVSSAVLETMAYTSYTQVTPVIYESVMKIRYSADAENAKMFDIMRAGATTDVGILYYMQFAENRAPGSMFRDGVQKNITNWTSYYKTEFEVNMKEVVSLLNVVYGNS